MKPILCAIVVALAAKSAFAQTTSSVYAEDVLQQEEQAQTTIMSACAEVAPSGRDSLSTAEADALLCMASRQLPLAVSVAEYGCTDRSELLIGALLQSGVSFNALGRISTFYDTARSGGKNVFVLPDPSHGEAFNRAWQLTFGTEFPRTIRLKSAEADLLLDVDGEIKWNIGHIAPTVWVADSTAAQPQLKVLDPVLSPQKSLTPEEWRALQNAEAAAMVWGGLGEAPVILAQYLPAAQLAQLRAINGLGTRDEVDFDQMNRMLRDLPHDLRTDMQAKVLDIPEKAPWHPAKWHGYSFSGGLEQGGTVLPEWQPQNNALTQARIEAAIDNMELISAYDAMRAGFDDDVAFLEEVKRRLIARNKKPKEVIIYFDD